MRRHGKTRYILAAFLCVYVVLGLRSLSIQRKAGEASTSQQKTSEASAPLLAIDEKQEQAQEKNQGQEQEKKHVCTFACVVNCMDGRVQEPVRNFMTTKFGVDFVDSITEKGPNKILCDNSEQDIIARVKEKVDTSVNKHGAKVVAIVGHCDCAGNPLGKEHQIEHLKKARDTVKAFGFDAEIILLWVKDDWKTVELIE